MQKATEMGAGTIQPVITRYTQVQRLKADSSPPISSRPPNSCEVLSVPATRAEIGLAELLHDWRTAHGLRRLVFCDEAAPSATPVRQSTDFEGLPVDDRSRRRIFRGRAAMAALSCRSASDRASARRYCRCCCIGAGSGNHRRLAIKPIAFGVRLAIVRADRFRSPIW